MKYKCLIEVEFTARNNTAAADKGSDIEDAVRKFQDVTVTRAGVWIVVEDVQKRCDHCRLPISANAASKHDGTLWCIACFCKHIDEEHRK